MAGNVGQCRAVAVDDVAVDDVAVDDVAVDDVAVDADGAGPVLDRFPIRLGDDWR